MQVLGSWEIQPWCCGLLIMIWKELAKALRRKVIMLVGKWDLERTIGDIGGVFTLLFKKIKGRWVIITDHTSVRNE